MEGFIKHSEQHFIFSDFQETEKQSQYGLTSTIFLNTPAWDIYSFQPVP